MLAIKIPLDNTVKTENGKKIGGVVNIDLGNILNDKKVSRSK